MSGIAFRFVGNLNDESKTGEKPWYKVTAKGDLYDFKWVLTFLRDEGYIEESRANIFLKILPQDIAEDFAGEKERYLEIPYKEAVNLQQYLLGWSGMIRRVFVAFAKDGTVDSKKTQFGEVDTSKWDDIEIDVAIQDFRDFTLLTKISLPLYGNLGLGLSIEEQRELGDKPDRGIMERIIGNSSEAAGNAAKQLAKGAGDALVAARKLLEDGAAEFWKMVRFYAIAGGLTFVGAIALVLFLRSALRSSKRIEVVAVLPQGFEGKGKK